MKLKDKDMENIIKISAKNKWTIVTENLLKADDIYKKAKEMKLKIPCPKTFYELEHTPYKRS